MTRHRLPVLLALVLTAVTAVSLGGAAHADNSTVTGPFGSGRHIEVRVWKAPGNASPGFQTSVWTYNGAALWRVDTVTDTTTLYANTCCGWGASFSKDGVSGSLSTGSTSIPISWTNNNAYEAQISGNFDNNAFNTISTKVCARGSAYSSALGVNSSQPSTCAGWF